MRGFLKSSARWLRAGWFWPLVLLALPNCGLSTEVPPGNPPAFKGGPEPRSSAVMCDIPKVPDPASNGCASSTEIGAGISTEHAAVALAQGEHSSIALDFSAAALAACSGGPKKTQLQGQFPDGSFVCLNCGTQMPAPYPDGNAACVAKCTDLVNSTESEPPGGAQVFCLQNAHVSTNFDKNTCFTNACSSNGTPNANFVDPRRAQEPVIWVEQNGTMGGSSGDNVSRTAGRSGNFDAGAFSKQPIAHGDAWVEFQVSDNTKAYAVGFSEKPGDHETLEDIPFALVLQPDATAIGKVYIFENGVQVGDDHGTYTTGDRFRVHIVEKTDGSKTATLFAAKLNGPCTVGTICSETKIDSLAASPAYPFQVDVSLVDPGAILQNVTMVRIQ
jgi:hypothetical protein